MGRLLSRDIRTAKQQEGNPDPPISVIYDWAEVLGVPVAELLLEPQRELSNPIAHRALLIKIMKTVRSLEQDAAGLRRKTKTDCASRVRIAVANLIAQLLELMPELAEIAAWPMSGHRRTSDAPEDIGRAAHAVAHVSPDLLYRVSG